MLDRLAFALIANHFNAASVQVYNLRGAYSSRVTSAAPPL
jgi:hypothetical protein